MKKRCRDGCRTSLLIAGVVLVPAIFHTSLPPCHPYITIHFMEMIFPLVQITTVVCDIVRNEMIHTPTTGEQAVIYKSFCLIEQYMRC